MNGFVSLNNVEKYTPFAKLMFCEPAVEQNQGYLQFQFVKTIAS
jgi:hypothetical protein